MGIRPRRSNVEHLGFFGTVEGSKSVLDRVLHADEDNLLFNGWAVAFPIDK